MKCFNCGKEIKDNLKFCTSCGADLYNRIKYEKEIINNDEEEGRDVASDKTALIAIILSIVLGLFIVIIGISSINRYKCIDCNNNIEPIEVDEKNFVFNYETEYKLFGETYKFKDKVGKFTLNGFEVDDFDSDESSNKTRSLKLYKADLGIKVTVVNEEKNAVPIDKYTIKELDLIYDDKIKSTNKMLELPESINFYDSFDKILEKYGEYDYQNNNCYVYKYSDTAGRVELCFNDDDLLYRIKIINEIGG